MRKILSEDRISEEALKAISDFHASVVAEVAEAAATQNWLVVGMAQNPYVRKARTTLAGKGIEFRYLEYGSYFSQWKQRLAIKLWSGWPTFPMVFYKGKLLGGAYELTKFLEKEKSQ